MSDQRLVGIDEVASLFGKSIESIRKYKNYGILKVADRIGNKDLFDREDVMSKKQLIKDLQIRGLSLSQIATHLDNLETTGPQGPYRLLLVDDEEEIRMNLRELFAPDYEVHEAVDGIDAIEKARAVKPDLILLDLRLPRLDGYQVCQRLKSDPATAQIPIIMVTALIETPQKVRGIEYGADDYVTKPFDLEEIAARVKMVLRRIRQRA
jgi:CheY-like chemotaxis protein